MGNFDISTVTNYKDEEVRGFFWHDTCEDVVKFHCKKLHLSPIIESLIGLQIHGTDNWLPGCRELGKNVKYVLRIRYKIPECRLKVLIDCIREYLYLQMRHDVINAAIPDYIYTNSKGQINGLCLSHMYVELIENPQYRNRLHDDGESQTCCIKTIFRRSPLRKLLRNYKKYVPRKMLKKYRVGLKSNLKEKLQCCLNNQEKYDITMVKENYIEEVHSLVSSYMVETYDGIVGSLQYEVKVEISPFDHKKPGLRIQYPNQKSWDLVSKISNLSSIELDERLVKVTYITQKDKTETFEIKMNTKIEAESFASSLNGYFRLTIDWTKEICPALVSSSLEILIKNHIHGPVGDKFAKEKVLNANEIGSFMIRQSDFCFDTLLIDIATEHDQVETFRIKQILSELPSNWCISNLNGLKSLDVFLQLIRIISEKDVVIPAKSVIKSNSPVDFDTNYYTKVMFSKNRVSESSSYGYASVTSSFSDRTDRYKTSHSSGSLVSVSESPSYDCATNGSSFADQGKSIDSFVSESSSDGYVPVKNILNHQVNDCETSGFARSSIDCYESASDGYDALTFVTARTSNYAGISTVLAPKAKPFLLKPAKSDLPELLLLCLRQKDASKAYLERGFINTCLGRMKVGAKLGSGNFGLVHDGTIQLISGGAMNVAFKMIPVISSYGQLKDFELEAENMKGLHHENIVEILGYCSNPPLIIMEKICGGSLSDYLKSNENLKVNNLLELALDIIKAMIHLGKKGIVHRDLAIRNIFVVLNNQLELPRLKLGDFGLARKVDKDCYVYKNEAQLLPILYHAPESLINRKFSHQSDVWSFGIMLWEMFCPKKAPFLILNDCYDQEKIIAALKNDDRLERPIKCPTEVYHHLIHPCWIYESDLRPNFKDLFVITEDFAEKY